MRGPTGSMRSTGQRSTGKRSTDERSFGKRSCDEWSSDKQAVLWRRGQLASGPLASGPLASGPLTSGPLALASGPLASGPLAKGPRRAIARRGCSLECIVGCCTIESLSHRMPSESNAQSPPQSPSMALQRLRGNRCTGAHNPSRPRTSRTFHNRSSEHTNDTHATGEIYTQHVRTPYQLRHDAFTKPLKTQPQAVPYRRALHQMLLRWTMTDRELAVRKGHVSSTGACGTKTGRSVRRRAGEAIKAIRAGRRHQQRPLMQSGVGWRGGRVISGARGRDWAIEGTAGSTGCNGSGLEYKRLLRR